jgi:hypothetical protein
LKNESARSQGRGYRQEVHVPQGRRERRGDWQELEGDFKVTKVEQDAPHHFYWHFTLENDATKENFVVLGHLIKE